MYVKRSKLNSDFWYISTNYCTLPLHRQDAVPAEFCAKGNIKIILDDVDRVYHPYITKEELTLFYQYNKEFELWNPLINNGRLL